LKRIVLLGITLSVLLIFASFPVTLSQTIPRPDHMIFVTIGEPETIDPAWSYDTASGTLIYNVYDALVFFDVDRTSADRTEWGKTKDFVPAIATDWTIETIDITEPETGQHWVERYTFTIREGIKFHDPTYGTVTPADVEYSFERWMVQCRSGGPTWMILEPTMGLYSTRGKTGAEAIKFGKMIDYAVESDGTTVWFNLVMPYAPLLAILAQGWASILSQQWCADHDDFPGFDVTGYDGWVEYSDPDVSPLDDYPAGTGGVVMMGTGAYKFDYWDKGVEWSITKFDDYYDGWPAQDCEGFVERVTEKFVSEWATRKMMFLAGDADLAYCPLAHLPEMWLNRPNKPEEYNPGIRCDPDLATLGASPWFFFNYNISATSALLGPGFDSSTPLKIAEDRIPTNFFGDANVRRAFASAFDYETYMAEIQMGEATFAPTPIIPGLPFYNPDQVGWTFDPVAAENFFKLAFGGTLWETGFTLQMSFNTGNVGRQLLCELLASVVEPLNPKFHLSVVGVDWPTYLGYLVGNQLTGFTLGWLADFADDHNFAMPFMHTEGDFSGYSNVAYGSSGRMQIDYTVKGVHFGDPTKVIDDDYVDLMIENGVKTSDETERRAIYYELQAIYVDEASGFGPGKASGRHWERDWVQGWYYNPIYPGNYFYHLWKALSTEYAAPEPVDISALGSITDLDGVKIAVTPGLVERYPDVSVDVTVHRLDTNPAVAALYVVIGVNRTDDTGYSVIISECVETAVLTAGASYTAEFVWTETLAGGAYVMSGVVGVVSGFAIDEAPENNIDVDGTVTVLVLVGDINDDAKVDIRDIGAAAKAFGSYPGHDRWNIDADIDGNSKIDIRDIAKIAKDFGKTLESLVAS